MVGWGSVRGSFLVSLAAGLCARVAAVAERHVDVGVVAVGMSTLRSAVDYGGTPTSVGSRLRDGRALSVTRLQVLRDNPTFWSTSVGALDHFHP
jgi:hypothetical protein